jgi:HEPN domain-containing protein
MPKPVDVFWKDLCFDAQQCVEKSLKSLLIFYGIKFRYIHDIGEFLQTLSENDIIYPLTFKDAVILTEYAVESRYPILSEEVTEIEHKKAVEIAELVYTWIESEISKQLKIDL